MSAWNMEEKAKAVREGCDRMDGDSRTEQPKIHRKLLCLRFMRKIPCLPDGMALAVCLTDML